LDGPAIFSANCNSCPTIGGGNLAGPDLKAVTEEQPQKWLVNFISDPNLVITSADPTVTEPLEKYIALVAWVATFVGWVYRLVSDLTSPPIS